MAAAQSILAERGVPMDAGGLFSQVFAAAPHLKQVVGKARRFCERNSDVLVFTAPASGGGGGGTVSLARRPGAGGAAGGFMFMCSPATEGECLRRALLGLQRNHLAKMQQIGPSTRLFLLNFKTRALHGPFRADGAAALDVVPDAWGGKFPAQIRVVGTAGSYFTATLPKEDTGRQMGAMSSERADELETLLRERGQSLGPPLGGTQQPATRRGFPPGEAAKRVATEFWAFLGQNPSLLSNDRAELEDTYSAWRSDPSNWAEPPAKASPSSVLRALVRILKVITVKDGSIIMYTARARVALSDARQRPPPPPQPPPQPQPQPRTAPAATGLSEAVPQTCRSRMSNQVTYTLVDNLSAAVGASNAIVRAMIASQTNGDGLAIGLDLEWSPSSISLVQVSAAPDLMYVFDVQQCPHILTETGPLRELLENSAITKVIHDCREDQAILQSQFGIKLDNVFDTSAADTVLRGVGPHSRRGLNAVLQNYANRRNTVKHTIDHYRWSERPLPAHMLEYAAQDVMHLIDAYYEMLARLQSAHLVAEMQQRTKDNLMGGRQVSPAVKDKVILDRIIGDTADAFHNYLEEHPMALEVCSVRVQFKEHFDNWKQREAAEGRERRGGAEAVRIKLVRNGHLVAQTANVVQQPGQTNREAARIAAANVHEQRASVESNKGGIQVDTEAAFEEIVPAGSNCTCVYKLTNTGQSSRRLTAALLTGRNGVNPFAIVRIMDSARANVELPHEIGVQQLAYVMLSCSARSVGVMRTIVSLQFDCGQGRFTPSPRFTIGRFVEVRCGNSELARALQPVSPYVRRQRRVRRDGAVHSIPGVGLVMSNMPEWPHELDRADCPTLWRQMMELGEADDWLSESQRTLCMSTYEQHWRRLLWAEEKQLEIDIREFDMENTTLGTVVEHRTQYLTLTVPGLAESRPSVLKGDQVEARISRQRGTKWRGVAHRVHRDLVDLRFDPRFHQSYVAGLRFDIQFVLNRSTQRLFQQGCRLAPQLPQKTLFPELGDLLQLASVRAKALRMPRNATLNQQQLQAVEEIVAGVCRPIPYLLFGPPGTGKTVTLVEAIYQIFQTQRTARILACAPTNTAADLLIERLSTSVLPSEMLRIMAFSRPLEAVGSVVRPYTLRDEVGFVSPSLQQVKSYRIVVATLTSAGKLFNLGVERGWFQTIVIDEGGQSLEPEAIAPVAPLLSSHDQLVIAGDPKQLGPIVHSPVASKHGLSMSLLERLIQRPVYNQDRGRYPNSGGFNPRVLTKLLHNYRAHPDLLHLPNSLFYEGELIAAANPTRSHSLAAWEHLVTTGVPLIFHGVEGKDEREANSPSWFNTSEIELVIEYVKKLVLDTRTNRVAAEDIGIITPYAKQKQKMRDALAIEAGRDTGRGGRGMFRSIKVGSTEEFQGQERRVIILTTVRTSKQFVESDAKHNLGFLTNPKRFNVATTRAQALMVVVGDPRVLHDDKHWGALLKYCVEKGAYCGCALPAENDEETRDALARQMEDLLRDEEEEGVPDSDEGSDDEREAAPTQRMQQEQLPIERND